MRIMAVEFDQYLQTCELSEFCATLQSSLTNLITCNNHSTPESSVNSAVLNNSSTPSQETDDKVRLINEACSFKATEVAAYEDTTPESKNSGREEVLHVGLEVFDTKNSSSYNGIDLLDEAFRVNNNNDIMKENDFSEVVLQDHDLKPDSDSAACTKSLVKLVDNTYSRNSFLHQSPSDFNHISTSKNAKATDSLQTSSSSANTPDDGKYQIESPEPNISRNAEQRNHKSCQRQLSLPASYSSMDVEHSFKASQRCRRRHSVRFADEMGETLSTFVVIPSNEDALIEAYSNSQRDCTEVSTNSWNHKDRASDGVNFSWASNSLMSVGEVLERRRNSSAATRNCDSVLLFNLCFDQPSKNYDNFLRRLQVQGVSLESVTSRHGNGDDSESEELTTGPYFGECLDCKVKVKNIEASKSVVARCTYNDWQTFTDIAAVYIPENASEGQVKEYNTFFFSVSKPKRLNIDKTSTSSPLNRTSTCAVEFAIRYQAAGLTFWDNNSGKNYRIVWS